MEHGEWTSYLLPHSSLPIPRGTVCGWRDSKVCKIDYRHLHHRTNAHLSKVIKNTKMLPLYGSDIVFHALTFARSRGRCWKWRPKAAVFNTSQLTWRMLMHWKTMFDRYYCIKNENICHNSRFFLHYFVSPFHRCLANVISKDYARSRAGQYTSRNGSKSVAPVRSYWKLRSRALTARELPC